MTEHDCTHALVGFTALEVVLTIAILTILAGIGIPVLQSFYIRNELDIATAEYVQALRQAIVLSQAVDTDSSWGVKIATGAVTVFQGDSYTERTIEKDDIRTFPVNITASGITEHVFSELYGLPMMIGTTTFMSSTNGLRTIHVNEKSVIQY